MNLLLAPHSDDESLFASYIALEHHPIVVICLQGRRKKTYPTNETREAETAAAMSILGCDYAFLPVPCDPPDWQMVEACLRTYDRDLDAIERVFAPLPERQGHEQHNAIGNLAAGLWPGRVTFYATYTLDGGRSTVGSRIVEQPGWPELKQSALGCYQSQSSKSGTAMHFHRDPAEHVIDAGDAFARNGRPGVKLNLGSGPNPIGGFVNLDKADGWLFEQGLGSFADGTVEAITVSHALMYVPAHHWPAVFAEFERVLEPRGVLRITEDAIGQPGSSRTVIRPRAAVATNPDLVIGHILAAGMFAEPVTPNVTHFSDRSLIQANYGSPPDVFHVEAIKP